ncbi:MAG: putative metal-binding motif-containing protein [Deltaproteobacteria bacterium]|nr:putative metal-binding motif-containing protein [Deltaproteobacteria bacterium]
MRLFIKLAVIAIFLASSVTMISGTADARGAIGDAWQAFYASSTSRQNVTDGSGKQCEFCHETSSGGDGWNGYGWVMKVEINAGATNEQAFATIENQDSDGNGDSNLVEINANTQPGWTATGNTINFKRASSYDIDGPTYIGALDPGAPEPTCTDADNDTFSVEGGDCGAVDCDDSDGAVNPAATEACNGIDDNCDGATDEGVTTTYYNDLDSDTYGDALSTAVDCSAPSGYVSDSTDCNDSDAAVNPAATEICGDGIDNDCVGGDATCAVNCTDDDLDTYATEGGDCGPVDCNDANSAIHPGAEESCTDGIDNDCDDLVDNLDPDAVGCPLTCTDADADSYATEGGDCGAVDCNDADDSINPGACDILADGIDQDCSGKDKLKGKACSTSEPDPEPSSSPEDGSGKSCFDGVDNDLDGLVDCDDSGCFGTRKCL